MGLGQERARLPREDQVSLKLHPFDVEKFPASLTTEAHEYWRTSVVMRTSARISYLSEGVLHSAASRSCIPLVHGMCSYNRPIEGPFPAKFEIHPCAPLEDRSCLRF